MTTIESKEIVRQLKDPDDYDMVGIRGSTSDLGEDDKPDKDGPTYESITAGGLYNKGGLATRPKKKKKKTKAYKKGGLASKKK